MILLAHECRRTPGSWVREIAGDPRDPLPWQMFADWWEDQGDTRRAAAVRWLARKGKWPVRREAGDGGWLAGWVWWAGCIWDTPAAGRAAAVGLPLWDALALRAKYRRPAPVPRRAYPSPEAAVLDLLRVWTPDRAAGWPDDSHAGA